jgi:hypothetical protein
VVGGTGGQARGAAAFLSGLLTFRCGVTPVSPEIEAFTFPQWEERGRGPLPLGALRGCPPPGDVSVRSVTLNTNPSLIGMELMPVRRASEASRPSRLHSRLQRRPLSTTPE